MNPMLSRSSPTIRLAVTDDGMPSKKYRYTNSGLLMPPGKIVDRTRRFPEVRLAHVPGAQGDNNLLGRKGISKLSSDKRPSVLISYWYLEKFLEKQERYAYRDWMMDSGAFSAYNNGEKIDLGRYVEICHLLLENDPTLVEIIALDVIGSGEDSLKNAHKMKDSGLDVIPVFHIGEDWDILREYSRCFNKIGLSCRFGEPVKTSMRFYEQCFARIWPKKCHSFGWVSEEMLFTFPFHSADSADWEIKPCLDGESLIQTTTGLERLIDLYENKTNFSVITNNGAIVNNCSAIYSGYKEVLQVGIKTSQYVNCTLDHKISTDRGWKEAGELELGDMVRVPKGKIRSCKREESSLDEMFGWITGDGCYLQLPSGREVAAIVFADKIDEEAMEKLIPVWDKFTESSVKLNANKNETGGVVYTKVSESKYVIAKLAAFGFKFGKANVKELPSYLFTGTSTQQLAFMRGLFSADGCVKSQGGYSTSASIKQKLQGGCQIALTSTSRKMLEQVQLILIQYGIQSHISWSKAKSRNILGREIQSGEIGELTIAGLSGLRYMFLIGFNLTKKVEMYQEVRFKHLLKEFYPVTEIRSLDKRNVYDVIMPEVHHFLANGIVVHNCQFGTWRAFADKGSTNYLNWKGSSQNLEAEINWYLKLEEMLRVRWKKEMLLLD